MINITENYYIYFFVALHIYFRSRMRKFIFTKSKVIDFPSLPFIYLETKFCFECSVRFLFPYNSIKVIILRNSKSNSLYQKFLLYFEITRAPNSFQCKMEAEKYCIISFLNTSLLTEFITREIFIGRSNILEHKSTTDELHCLRRMII